MNFCYKKYALLSFNISVSINNNKNNEKQQKQQHQPP